MKKPDTCRGCPLEFKGLGYAPAVGPSNAKIALIGEALGAKEAVLGKPFVGQAGGMLDRILRLAGTSREIFRIDNVIRCQPPNNWLDGAPWEHEAINHCSRYCNETLSEPHEIVMPLGGIPTRILLGLAPGVGKVQDFHGTISRDIHDRFWVVPTFHPSHIQRGAHNLTGVSVHDFKRALEIAKYGFDPASETPELVVDPPLDWWCEWVDEALRWAEQQKGPHPPWLTVDIETPEKARVGDEGELEMGKTKIRDLADIPSLGDVERPPALKDRSNVILRVNFAYRQDQGVTVPFSGGYKDGIRLLCATPLFSKVFWNINYDRPRLEINGCPVAHPAHDFMWAWHMLQSDLPKGLGFASPFYNKRPPWKHLSDESPGEYGAEDGVRTVRCAYGIEDHLGKLDMWGWYWRHIFLLDHLALEPASDVGLLVDPGIDPCEEHPEGTGLKGFSHELGKEKDRISTEIRVHVPDSLRPVNKVLKTERALYSDKESKTLKPEYVDYIEPFEEQEMKLQCSNCGKIGVRKGHENTKACNGATLTLVEVTVPRWRIFEDFNPSSSKQMLTYIKWRGHRPGHQKKDRSKPSADVSALEALEKRHPKDPVYPLALDLRKVDKMKGTYADGMLKRMDDDHRVHSTFMHKPSTLRLSSGDPNLQNLVKRDPDEETAYARRFRECIIAGPGCVLIEADYAGIEAVEVGWFSADPAYIRLANMSVHGYLASHLLNKPASLDWDDETLSTYLAEIKHSKDHDVKAMYAKAKRCVHGTNYGMTPYGMRNNYPEVFETVKAAEDVYNLYMAVCPKLHEWQKSLIQRAHKYGYLGGKEHPFRYRHWFWNVINHKRLSKSEYLAAKRKKQQVIENSSGYWSVQLGEDAKRAIAFFPQSTAGGILKEAMLNLFDPELEETYIGEAYYGKTPFRMPIHDSLVLEVPENKVDFVLERLLKVMLAPVTQQPCPKEWGIGQEDGLRIGVEAEVGKDWSKMKEIKNSDYYDGTL